MSKKSFLIFFSVFIIFLSVFIVPLNNIHAEGNTTISDVFGQCNGFLTLSGWQNSSSYESGYIVNFSSNDINLSLLNNLNNLPIPSEIPDISEKKIYVFYESGNNFDIFFVDKKYNIQDYNEGILALGFASELTDEFIYKVYYTYSNDSYTYTFDKLTPNADNSAVPPIRYLNVGDGGYLCAASDVIYACDNYTANLPYAMSYFAYFLVDYSNQPYQYVNSNYIAIDMGEDGGFGGSGSGSESGETSANNLYMENPNWQFKNIPSFGTILDTNSRGQAIFSAQLTDYQKENLNKFRLDFTFNTFWNGNTYHIGVDDVTVIKDPFSKSFLYQVQVPLSQFYSGGSMYSIYIDDIFNNSVSSDQDQTVDDFASFYINEYNHETSNFRTSFTVNLVSLDNSGDSGSCTAYYSYKTGTSQTTNNSMGINNNPYVDDDGSASGVTDPTQDSSGSGSGSGVGNVGDGSIVNNNNPVININNNNTLSDGDSDGLISKILLLIANNQSATSSGIEEIADTSGFVDLMGASWLAVPTTWWTTLTAAFIASIGILVVGFILKIIIGLIF